MRLFNIFSRETETVLSFIKLFKNMHPVHQPRIHSFSHQRHTLLNMTFPGMPTSQFSSPPTTPSHLSNHASPSSSTGLRTTKVIEPASFLQTATIFRDLPIESHHLLVDAMEPLSFHEREITIFDETVGEEIDVGPLGTLTSSFKNVLFLVSSGRLLMEIEYADPDTLEPRGTAPKILEAGDSFGLENLFDMAVPAPPCMRPESNGVVSKVVRVATVSPTATIYVLSRQAFQRQMILNPEELGLPITRALANLAFRHDDYQTGQSAAFWRAGEDEIRGQKGKEKVQQGEPMKMIFFSTKPYQVDPFLSYFSSTPTSPSQSSSPYIFEHASKTLQLQFHHGIQLNPQTMKTYFQETPPNSPKLVSVFVNDIISREVADYLSKCGVEAIFVRATGTDNIDVASCREFGIGVFNVPKYSPEAIAEHALALLLCLTRHLHQTIPRTSAKNFSITRSLVGTELASKTIGILGTGSIGTQFARLMTAFRPQQILAFDAYPNDELKSHPLVQYVSLEHVLRHSDVISVHLPLTSTTRHTIHENNLELLKQGVTIINTSRGGLISTKALLKGLETRRIAAVGLDVIEGEENLFDATELDDDAIPGEIKALLANENVILTPHLAYLTKEALDVIAKETMMGVREWLEGKRGAELTNFVEPK